MQKTLALALVTLALAVPAAAHGPNDHDRQERSGRRARRDTVVVVASADVVADVEADIRRGVARGQLTHREAESLRESVRDFEHLRRRVLRDGRVSRGEEVLLARAADQLEWELRRQLHDDDRRGRFDARGAWRRDGGARYGDRRDDRGGHHDGGFDPRPVVAVNAYGHGC